VAATAAGAITLLLLVYMSQQWVPRFSSIETIYPEIAVQASSVQK
jgi:hypothetical protein